MEKHGYFSQQECACGCLNLLPSRLVDIGRRYLYAHKGFGNGSVSVAKRQMKPRAPKPGPVEHTNYARALEMVAEDLVALMEGREMLAAKHATLTLELREIEEKVAAVEKRIAECEALGAALEPFLPKPEPQHVTLPVEGEAA